MSLEKDLSPKSSPSQLGPALPFQHSGQRPQQGPLSQVESCYPVGVTCSEGVLLRRGGLSAQGGACPQLHFLSYK